MERTAMKLLRVLALLIFGAGIASPHASEINPTPQMLVAARRVIPPEGRMEYHFRRQGGLTLVCGYLWGRNGGFCSRTPMSLVKKIDLLAEDACRQGEDVIPHALTGEADVLSYRCVGSHMKRDPYYVHFDREGYHVSEWRELR
jgi:hypothetical protein